MTDATAELDRATYRAREFATLAGVTVRTLHHYDRLGLLTPRRTPAGHRVYSPRDFEALQHIIALKLIGVPLREISTLRGARGEQLGRVLRAQRARLEGKRQRLGALIAAIRDIEDVIDHGQQTGPTVFRRIIEVMDMQTEDDEWAAVVRATSAHRQSLRPEALAELGQRGEALLADVQRLLDEEPASPAVQAIAARWTALIVEMNGPAVPIATLRRTGQATYRDAVTRKPELAKSAWGRAISLLSQAAEIQR